MKSIGSTREAKLTTIAVSGFSSNAGKMTRGHYRSCGKDPHACCVSHLLKEEPVIRSGRAETYAVGKDTGRYWEAGASNVHWAIVTDGQVEQGIKDALARVSGEGVFVEGTSFVNYLDVDLMLMCARASGGKIKPSARRMMKKAAALYLFDEGEGDSAARATFASWLEDSGVPLYTRADFPQLVERVRAVHSLVNA